MGNNRPLSLFWNHDHYQVLTGGANLEGLALANNLIAHNPTGDGNCMYEAMYYIAHSHQHEGLGPFLRDNARQRAVRVNNMRLLAANSFDPFLANILGEEMLVNIGKKSAPRLASSDEIVRIMLGIYKAYPPKDYYLGQDKKLYFYARADEAKVNEDVNSIVLKEFKVDNQRLRADILAVIERDRNYLADPKAVSKKVLAFDRTNSASWNMLAPVYVDGVTKKEVDAVNLEGDHANYDAILNGIRTNNQSIGGAQTGFPYHSHMVNNGAGGVAFYYRHTGKGNDVEPVFYAVATSRVNNIYSWSHGYGKKNSHPERKSGYK